MQNIFCTLISPSSAFPPGLGGRISPQSRVHYASGLVHLLAVGVLWLLLLVVLSGVFKHVHPGSLRARSVQLHLVLIRWAVSVVLHGLLSRSWLHWAIDSEGSLVILWWSWGWSSFMRSRGWAGWRRFWLHWHRLGWRLSIVKWNALACSSTVRSCVRCSKEKFRTKISYLIGPFLKL